MNILIILILNIFLFFNLTSCITPPPGGCAYSNDSRPGTINIISVEDFNGQIIRNASCYDPKVVKFKFISKYTDPEKIYSQVYPSDFINEKEIVAGKSFSGNKQIKYAGNCKDEIFDFDGYTYKSNQDICDKNFNEVKFNIL